MATAVAAVKRYSNTAGCQALVALSLFMAAFTGFITGFLWTLPRDIAPTWIVGLVASTILIFLAFALVSLRGARFWNRQDAKRQAAVLGVGSVPPLAIEQPIPRSIPLLPRGGKTTELRIKPWLRPLFLMLIASACVAVSYDPDHSGPILGFSTCGIIAAALLAISMAFQVTSGPHITVTDEGLAFAAFGFRQAISWDQVTLFCIPRGKPHSGPRYFELSGPSDVVQWWRLRPGSLLARIYEPAASFPDYDAQMDALLSLIAARTGLPLHDLR